MSSTGTKAPRLKLEKVVRNIESHQNHIKTLTDRRCADDGDPPDDLAPPTAGQQDTQLAEVEGEHQQGDGQGQQEATANSIIVIKRQMPYKEGRQFANATAAAALLLFVFGCLPAKRAAERRRARS